MSAVPAVEQAIAILTYLASVPGTKANLTDIADAVGIYKSKAQAILNTLQKYQWVLKNSEDKFYKMGLGMVPFGRKALDNLDYREIVKPFLIELAQQTHCTAQFSVISGDHLVVIALQESGELLDYRSKVGYVFPLFEGTHGKLVLAFMSEEARELVLAEGKYTLRDGSKCTDIEGLRREIAECRKKGYAADLHMPIPMIKIMASPVLGLSSYPIGVLFIIGVFPKSAAQDYGAKLHEAARKVSALLLADTLR